MKDGCLVKICGTTNMKDALLAAEAGADYFGVVVETDFSPRSLKIEDAGELFTAPPVPAVALVFNMTLERLEYLIRTLRPFAIQFLNHETPDKIKQLKTDYPEVQLWQSIHLPVEGQQIDEVSIIAEIRDYIDSGIDLILIDTVAVEQGVQKFGGTGRTSDWQAVRQVLDKADIKVPVLLAGGINPGNVAQAIEAVRPDGVDLCSGVEAQKGIKDAEKVRELIKIVKSVNGI